MRISDWSSDVCSSDLIAIRGALFGAVGTAGQRCTTTRRLIIHQEVYDEVKQRLINAYGHLKIGNPLDPDYHVGPLIDKEAVKRSEESRVGQECVSTCRSRWSPSH